MAKRKKKIDVNQTSILDTSYTEEQSKFVHYTGKKSVVLASVAGSGKTTSCVGRLMELLKRGVDPKKIIFFSFTKAATEELKKRIESKNVEGCDKIKITTIHAFCYHILSKAGKFKDVTNFFEFIEWYKTSFKPSGHSKQEEIDEFYDNVSEMYETADLLSSQIGAFKLQKADGISAKLPSYFFEYEKYQKEKRARDFADMLIEVFELFKDNKWLNMFKNKYDYIFIDEFQDTSTIQLKILLNLNAKYYYLIGDKNQSIFLFSGVNYDKLVELLAERREMEKMTLTINFRSDVLIVENSNNFSDLMAKPSSSANGEICSEVLTSLGQLKDVLDNNREVAVLVRTNKVIKYMEQLLLAERYPMRYFNYITDNDIKNHREGKHYPILTRKFRSLEKVFGNADEVIKFIEENKKSDKFITTIHKSKGREFDVCVVVNSIAPDILDENGFSLPPKLFKKVSFDYADEEKDEQNIHYVAVSRPRHKLYYMLYGTP